MTKPSPLSLEAAKESLKDIQNLLDKPGVMGTELAVELIRVRDGLKASLGESSHLGLKEAINKQAFEEVYAIPPAERLGGVLERSERYDRVGPIKLPVLVNEILERRDDQVLIEANLHNFVAYYYAFFNGQGYFVITRNSDLDFEDPMVRVSSNCNWAFDFGSQRCECAWELELAKQALLTEQDGFVIFAMDQHGKSVPGGTLGHSLIYALGQDQNQDLVRAAYVGNNFELDYRDYGDVYHILRELGVASVRLMTNNPDRCDQFEAAGFAVKRTSIEVDYHKVFSEELGVKKERLNHMLKLPGFKPEDVTYYGLDPERVWNEE